MSNIPASVSKVKFQEPLSALAEVNSSLVINFNRGSPLPTQQFQVNIKHQGHKRMHQKSFSLVIFLPATEILK